MNQKTEKRKVYKANHEDIKVYCPKCNRQVTGWTMQRDWGSKAWLNHVNPIKAVQCWLSPKELVPIEKVWEQKYTYIT